MRRYVTDVIKARIVYWRHVITFETRVNENSCILFFEALDNFVAFVPKSCAVFLKCWKSAAFDLSFVLSPTDRCMVVIFAFGFCNFGCVNHDSIWGFYVISVLKIFLPGFEILDSRTTWLCLCNRCISEHYDKFKGSSILLPVLCVIIYLLDNLFLFDCLCTPY